jgi:hypothetical protein
MAPICIQGESRVYTELHIPESLKRNLEKDSIYIAEMKKVFWRRFYLSKFSRQKVASLSMVLL